MTRRRAQHRDDAPAAPPSVPPWPRLAAILHADGSGELTINAQTQPFTLADTAAARRHVIELVRSFADDELGRPVRLLTTDPDGRKWELGVYPDGRVVELAELTTAPAPPPAQPNAAAPRARHRPTMPRALALLAVALACAGLAAIVTLGSTSAPTRPRPTRNPAPATRSPAKPAATPRPKPPRRPHLHSRHPSRHARQRARPARRRRATPRIVPAPAPTHSPTPSAPAQAPAPAPAQPSRPRGQFNF